MLNGGNNTLLVNPSGTLPTVAQVILNNGTIELNNNSQVIGSLSNNDPIAGTGGTIQNTGPDTVNLVSVTQAATTFAGTIAGRLNFAKYGNSALTLTNNQYLYRHHHRRHQHADPERQRHARFLADLSQFRRPDSGSERSQSGGGSQLQPSGQWRGHYMQGGTFTLQGGGSMDAITTLGSVNAQSGQNTIISVPLLNQGSTTTEIINNLDHSASKETMVDFSGFTAATGTLALGQTTLNGAGRIYLDSVNGTPFAASSMTGNILGGWAIADGNSFASYNDLLGVGALGSVGYAAFEGTDVSTTTTATQNINDGLQSHHRRESLCEYLAPGSQCGADDHAGKYRHGGHADHDYGHPHERRPDDHHQCRRSGFATDLERDGLVRLHQSRHDPDHAPITGAEALVKSGATGAALSMTPSFFESATTVSGNSTVTVTSTAGLSVGQGVSGTGIPVGAVITSIGSGKITISVNASSSATNISISA
ncbi:MAG: hypothetical protein WDN28_13125 [Chthoniobacter sp.]